MPETKRFDPLGWFISACFTILAGAIALVIAIHLIAAVWVWFATIACTAAGISVVVALLIGWHRRQPW